jgi:hypothetical protein
MRFFFYNNIILSYKAFLFIKLKIIFLSIIIIKLLKSIIVYLYINKK